MVKEYIFIYSIYVLFIYLFSIITYEYKIVLKHPLLILFILIFIGAGIAACRPPSTQDTELYNLVYDSSLSYLSVNKISNFHVLFANRSFYNIEIFYVILMAIFRYFFKSPVFFYFIQGVVSNIAMVLGLFRLCEYAFELDSREKRKYFICRRLVQLYSFYVVFCGVLYTSSAIRDGLSVSLGLVAIGNLLLNRKKIISIVLLISSILIHTTSIIFLPIYFLLKICNLKFSKNWTLLLCGLVPILYMIKIGKYFVSSITKIIEVILQTLNIQAFYSYIRNLSFELPLREGYLLLLTCVIICCCIIKNRTTNKYLFVVFCGLYMFVFAYPITALARLLYIFILFLLPIVMEKTKHNSLVHFISILYLVPQFVYVFGYL